MTSQLSSWITTVTTGAAMLVLGVRLKMLSLPSIRTRCGACGRLVWRVQTCPCARTDRD